MILVGTMDIELVLLEVFVSVPLVKVEAVIEAVFVIVPATEFIIAGIVSFAVAEEYVVPPTHATGLLPPNTQYVASGGWTAAT